MNNNFKLFLGSILILFIGILLGTTIVLYYQAQEEGLTPLKNYEKSVETKFVAVDNEGKGLTATLITDIRPGTGLVLVNINDVLADINTQYSARTAAQIASNHTKISLEHLDVIYKLQTEASIVGGQSAGTIMAISTIAALSNTTLKPNIIATGSVNPAGEVVDAGGIVAKATAAKQDNFTLFLVPEGRGSNPTEFKRYKSCTNTTKSSYCYVEYKGEQISIGKDIGIEVKEVKTVAEALRYFE